MIQLDYENDNEKESIAQWAREVAGISVTIDGRGDVRIGFALDGGWYSATYKRYIDPEILHQYISSIISTHVQHPYHVRYPQWLAKKTLDKRKNGITIKAD